VKVAHSPDEVRSAAKQILGMHLVTHRPKEGQVVRPTAELRKAARSPRSFISAW